MPSANEHHQYDIAMTDVKFPIDPAGRPRSAEDLRREIQVLFSSYHASDLDFIIENIQNSFDALEEAYKKVQDPAPCIEITFDSEANIFRIADNGLGISNEVINKIGTPSNSDKDPKRKRGHKGVGLVFAAWSTIEFKFATKRSGESAVIAGKLAGAYNWIKGEDGDNPKIEEAPEFQPNFLKGKITGTVFEFTLPTSSKVKTLLTRLNADGLMTLLRTKTALGFVQLPETNRHTYPNWIQKLRVLVHIDNNKHQVKTGYLFPHEKYSDASYDTGQRSLPNKLEKMKGSKRCIYRVLDAPEVLKIFSNDDDYSHLRDTVEKHQVKAYGAFLDSALTFRDWSSELYTQNPGRGRKQDIVKPGIHFATSTMPCGETVPIHLTYATGNADRAFVIVDLDSAQPDQGRKTFQSDIVEIAQKISEALIKEFVVEYRQLLVPRSRPHGPTEAEQVNALNSILKMAENKKDLAIQGLGIAKEPTEEQEVVALFHALIATERLKGYHILAAHGSSQKYDGVFRYEITKDQNNLYPYEKLGLPEISFGSNSSVIFPPSIIEYKAQLSGLISDFGEERKKFSEIRLVVAWDKGDQKAFESGSTYELDKADRQTNEVQFYGETHILRNTNSTDIIHVILLADVLDTLSNQ